MIKRENLTDEQLKLVDELVVAPDPETVKNPFSGESVELEPEAVALYDYIKGCEALRYYGKMEVALPIFRESYPEEYMILLD